VIVGDANHRINLSVTKLHAIVIWTILIAMAGCLVRSEKYNRDEFARVESCSKNRAYKDLVKQTDLKVLLFMHKFHYDMSSFPNFIIGVTPGKDTIGVIDKDFDGELLKNEEVSISPVNWDEFEKQVLLPVSFVCKKRSDNDLQCSVKVVYRAQINKKH
jgi:hypothetical protein